MIHIDPFNFSIGVVLQSWVFEYNPDLRASSWDFLIPFMCFCFVSREKLTIQPRLASYAQSSFSPPSAKIIDVWHQAQLLFPSLWLWDLLIYCVCMYFLVKGCTSVWRCLWTCVCLDVKVWGLWISFFIDLHIYFWRQGFSSTLKLMN